MNLPEHLKKKKRDELTSKYAPGFWLVQHDFRSGFTAAAAELLPMLEKLEGAIRDVMAEGHSELCKTMKPYRENYTCSFEIAVEALAELKKWRES